MNKKPYILLADDHAIIRRGLRVLLESFPVRSDLVECDSVRNIMQVLPQHPFTHLILDMQLQDGNVIDVLPEIVRSWPGIPVLIYTMSSEEIFGSRMLQLGASGFLSKQSSEQEVMRALDLFFSGRRYVSEELQDQLNDNQFKKTQQDNPIFHLSDRELSVLNYLLKGESVKEISGRLDLKATTVATYKARIFDKLNVQNVIELRDIAALYHYNKS